MDRSSEPRAEGATTGNREPSTEQGQEQATRTDAAFTAEMQDKVDNYEAYVAGREKYLLSAHKTDPKLLPGLIDQLASKGPDTKTLQKRPPSVIKDDRKDPRKVQPRFEYPQPDKEAELEALKEQVTRLADVARTVAGLGLEGADARLLVTGLHELSGDAETLARAIGMHAVSEGQMTQRELSQDLGVHEITVGKWVKAVREQEVTPALPQDK